MLMAAFEIDQKSKAIRKNKKLKMMLQVARIDIRKCKSFLASIFKSNHFVLCNGGKETIYIKVQQEKKIGLNIYGETDNLMNFIPGGGKTFV